MQDQPISENLTAFFFFFSSPSPSATPRSKKQGRVMESSLITLLFFSFGHELCAYCLQNPAYRLTWHDLSVPPSITFVRCRCATPSRQAIYVRSLNEYEGWFLTAKNCRSTQLCRSLQFSLKHHFTYTRCKDGSQHFAHDIWINISRPICAHD